MSRQLTLCSQVLLGFHHPNPKQACPDPIHGDSCGERILLRHEPSGEAHPVHGPLGWPGVQGLWHSRSHRRSRTLKVPFDQDMSFSFSIWGKLLHHGNRGGFIFITLSLSSLLSFANSAFKAACSPESPANLDRSLSTRWANSACCDK